MVRGFARSWVGLGDTEDLAEPVDFITGRIGMQPVIVIRQTDGSVKGFLNNCPHRASGLEFDPSVHYGRTLTCPSHQWAYSLDAPLVGIQEKNRLYGEAFPRQTYGLLPIRLPVA